MTAERTWRKSSHSGSNTACVEIGYWRKSAHSGSATNCVEIGWGTDVAAIRDSKSPTAGTLTISDRAFNALINTVAR
jgi:hypothetical protein